MDKTELRLRLLANGFSPIRNYDKRTFMTGWTSATIDEDEIRSWARKHDSATGIRIENGLAAIDIDVNDEAVVNELAEAIFDIAPQLADERNPLPVRHSGKAKEAWFVRTDEPFTRLHSRRWLRPGENPEEHDTHFVEVFGGAAPRQFGVFGPHTLGDDGTVLRAYQWRDVSLLDVTLDELPVVTKKQFAAIVDAAERIMQDAGWEPVLRSTKGENTGRRIYDLTEDMLFVCDDGMQRDLAGLRDAAADYDGLRCSASWLEGPSAKRTDRCLVSLTRSGHVAIWVSDTGETHTEKSAEPVDYGPEIDRIAEKLKELDERRRRKIKGDDDMLVAAAKMRETHAYCPSMQNAVVPLWASSPDEGVTVTAFRLQHLPNCAEEVGPRGGVRKINPVDVWLSDAARVTVAGIRMRPDQPRPTFEDGGKLYVNCYDPPLHLSAGGDTYGGVAFMEHLLPDREEREWFLDWLAFKLRYPHIPGPAVVMVAHRTFGTGRGTLGVFMGKLFGERYVRSIPFETFTGKTYQSQYNDWQADALMVIVNESSEDTDGGSFKTKRNTYEHLKEIVEPRPVMREINVKRERNYRAISSTSYLIATNHADALPIPEHDRRFCVLTNGGTKPVEWWADINEWMGRKENVAAFYELLKARDLTGYSPFATPPAFAGKLRMVDEAVSDIDRAFSIVLESLPSPFFVAGQIEHLMRQVERTHDIELPRGADIAGIVRRMLRRDMHRVGVRHGHNWMPMIDGKRYAAYARTADDAARGTKADASWLRDQILLNGNPEGGGVVSVLALDKLKR